MLFWFAARETAKYGAAYGNIGIFIASKYYDAAMKRAKA